jgi:hypothetical protein
MNTCVRNAVRVTLASVLGLLIGCGGESFEAADETTEESADQGAELELGTAEQGLCQNDGGVNGVLAAIAVASANEMARWLPTRDFQWNKTTGMLELSDYAVPRCRPESTGDATTANCPNTRALLDLQKSSAHGKVTFPGNIKLDSYRLRSTLKAYWDQQVACNLAGKCPVDFHDLRFHHTEEGPCGTRFFYDAFEMCISKERDCGPKAPRKPLTAEHANRFANQLLFLGHPSNPFLAFSVQNDRASVDPTYGLTESRSTTSGACRAACTMFSDASLVGSCCSCNGATRRFSRSAFNTNMYLCQ